MNNFAVAPQTHDTRIQFVQILDVVIIWFDKIPERNDDHDDRVEQRKGDDLMDGHSQSEDDHINDDGDHGDHDGNDDTE